VTLPKPRPESTPKTIQSVRDLSREQREDIEAMFDSGLLPSQIAKENDIPLLVIANLRREWNRDRKFMAPAPASQTPSTSELTAAQVQIQTQIAEMKMRMQLEEMRDELDAQKQKRRLDIEQRRLDLRRQRLEMREDYGDGFDDEPDEEEPEAIVPNSDPENYDFENNPIGAAMKFINELKNKPPKQTVTAPTVDVTKTLTKEQILEELKNASPTEITQLKAAPDALIEQGLRQRYPGITPENIKSVIAEIRHYGQQ